MANTAVSAQQSLPSESSAGPEDEFLDTRFRVDVRDLQPGARGEVVFFNDSAVRDIVLEAPRVGFETGSVKAHVTAEGIDVGGFDFVRFSNGITVYHTPDTVVTVVEI